MKEITLGDLQESVQDKSAFKKLDDYFKICCAFLSFIEIAKPTRIVSPSYQNYIFYQYDEEYRHKITRPLNLNYLLNLWTISKMHFLDLFLSSKN